MSSADRTERAVLAGGCFWGMQDLIRKMDGVVSTRVGYSGGDVPNATYRNHGTHAEAIEIVFDPERMSYRRLLEFFFQIHDPTTKNRQGNDRGLSYRSAIYFTSDEQKRVAEDTIADVTRRACGRARSSPSSRRRARSGKPSRSTRTTSRSSRTATPATTFVPAGACRPGRSMPLSDRQRTVLARDLRRAVARGAPRRSTGRAARDGANTRRQRRAIRRAP